MVAFAGHPLMVQNRIVGVMAMFARHPLSEMTLNALGSVAIAIAFGIERKWSAEALRESEKKYRTLFESSHDAVMTLAPPSWKFTSGNPATVVMFGTGDEAHFLSLGPWALSPEQQPDGRASAEKAQAMIETAMRDGTHFFEWTHRRINGEAFPATVLLSRLKLAGMSFLQATVRDIGEQKQAEAALQRQTAEVQRSRDMILKLTAQVPGVVYQYRLWQDGRSAFPFASPGMNDIYEVTPEEVRKDATPVFGRLHPDDYDRMVADIQESARILQPFHCEFRVVLPRQGLQWRLSDAMPERMEDGGTLWHGIISDITERKQAEAALESSLREKVALLNEVHHRVKNNLQVITSLLRMEARRSEHPTTKIVLDEMRKRILSMALLHESLYRTGTFASVDLGAYLKELASQSFRASVVRLGSVRLQLEMTSVQIEMDQALPCGLLVNELISNSLKHGFPGGRSGEVRVELQPVDGGPQVRLRVGDTGVGLPVDFEAKRGMSLGLQLVSDLVRQIDGRLEIGPGPGAVFGVTFTPKHSKPNPSTPTP
jgi:PAS domain S-box-containing protein